MKLSPEWNEEKSEDKISGMHRPIEPRDMVVGIEPHGDPFVASPDDGANPGSPKYIVVNLITKKEHSALSGGPLFVVFLVRPLAFERVKIEMKTAVVEPH